jgi:hypothetical protein
MPRGWRKDSQSEALAATIAEYRRLSPWGTGDELAVSGDVNRMIAAAINVDAGWFWRGPDAISGSCTCVPLNTGKHLECYTL